MRGKTSFEVDIELLEEIKSSQVSPVFETNKDEIFRENIFGLNSREQTLLVIAMWSVLAIFFFKIFGDAVQTFEQWKLNEQVITGHQQILSLKPSIDQSLEQQKKDQQNKSYDKKQLSNRASFLADEVFHKEIIVSSILMKERGTNSTESESNLIVLAMKMSTSMLPAFAMNLLTCS